MRSKNYFLKKDPYLLITLGLIFVSLAGLVVYILIDKTPPHWDAGRHFSNSRQYFDYLKYIFKNIPGKLNVQALALVSFLTNYFYYPPFYYYSTIPFLLIFGRTYQAALAVNIAWMSLLILSIYKYLKHLKFSNFAIIFGFAIILGSPFIIGQSREYQLDFPNLAMIFFLLWRLEAITLKRNTWNLILLCLAIAVGPMVKWHFILHASVVVGFYCVRWLYLWRFKFKNFNWSYYSQLLFTLVTSVASISGIWYIKNLLQLKIDLTKNATEAGIAEGDPQGFTVETYKVLTRYFTTYYFNLPWIILFDSLVLIVVSILIYKIVKKKKFNFHKKPHLFTLVFSIILFVLMLIYHINQSNKDPRYMAIIYVSFVLWMSLMGESIFLNLKNKIIKNGLLVIVIFIFGLNFVSLTFPREAKPVVAFEKSDIPIVVVNSDGYTNARLRNKDWAIYSALQKASELKGAYYGDVCTSDNYFRLKPTIKTDFDPQALHTSYGTVWGLAEQYDMTITQGDGCFIMVQRYTDSKKVGEDKYLNPKPIEEIKDGKTIEIPAVKYEYVETFKDWQGTEISLFRKKMSQPTTNQ